MSCSIILLPATLGPAVVTALLGSLVASSQATARNFKELENNTTDVINDLENTFVANAMNKKYKQYQTICSKYKTVFKDLYLLKKTLSEHGVQNIVEQDGKLYANLDLLKFEFVKGDDGVYEMHITHNENADLTITGELNEEYQLNVQEQSYMNIKKNLEKQDLKIDSEEVLEDNSIMLTVNLE